VGHPETASLLRQSGLDPMPQQRALRGIANEFAVYEIA